MKKFIIALSCFSLLVSCKKDEITVEKNDSTTWEIDKKIEVVGASSDHTILDVTHCYKKYQVGDLIEFSIDYGGLLSLCTSKYVNKVIV